MNAEALTTVLAKLRVKSGLHGESRPLFGPWRIGLWYSRSDATFYAELTRDARPSKMGLTNKGDAPDVETRGRSQWMADNTWRLTEAGIAKVRASILAVWADPRNVERAG